MTAELDGLASRVRRAARRVRPSTVRRAARTWAECRRDVVNLVPDPSRVTGGDDRDLLALGLRPGRRYTASVTVTLASPLPGPAAADLLRVVVTGDGAVVATSPPARNEPGGHRVHVTFTLPAGTTTAALRLGPGGSAAAGAADGAEWHALCVTRTSHPVPFFDGDTRNPVHEYRWLGVPQASPSVRVPRGVRAVAAGSGVSRPQARRVVADAAGRAADRGDLADAVRLARSLCRPPWRRDVLALVAASRAFRAAGHPGAAGVLLRTAVRLGDPDGDAAFELGRVAQNRRWWRRAASLYRTAAARRPDDIERGYRLAHALGRLKQVPEARKVLAATVARDPDLPFDGASVSTRVLNGFSTRREVAFFLVEELATIRAMARARTDALPPATSADPVFVYWGQGFAAAPPLVRACVARLREADPQAEIHELDDRSLPEYVDLPADLLAAVGDNRAHLSDLLRIALLERHGGVWLDATCYVTRPLRDHVPALLEDSDFFAFTYRDAHLSTWFLAARRGSYLVRMWRAAMWRWWELRGEVGDYFLVHHVFEMLHELDEEFRAEFARTTRLPSRPRHDLQHALLTPYDADRFAELTQASFVHKLTYKLAPEQVTPRTTAAHILRGDRARL